MSESSDQKEIIRWFRETYPHYAKCLRVSMGGVNFGYGSKAARKFAMMKSQGLVLGESDITVLLPRAGYGCLLIEYKSDEDKAGPSANQLDYISHHKAIGNMAMVCKGIGMAKDSIAKYMAGDVPRARIINFDTISEGGSP